MDKEDIKEYLKEHMTIRIEQRRDCGTQEITINLYIEEEFISSDDCYLD
jgi:hypothetical protein